MLLEAYIGPLIALAVTSGLILWLTPIARSVGLVDIPNARKAHKGEIPLIGGLSIFAAVFAAMIVFGTVEQLLLCKYTKKRLPVKNRTDNDKEREK